MSSAESLNLMHVRVGFQLTFDLPYPTPMLFVVEPGNQSGQRIVHKTELLDSSRGVGQWSRYTDSFGNTVWRVLGVGQVLEIGQDAIVEVSAHSDPQWPDLPKTPVEDLPDEVLQFLLPSRYVDSDLISNEAWERFGQIQGGWAQVQAISDHLHGACMYGAASNSSTTAQQAYMSGRAVCRDFAHMGVAFCRALNIPARYVCGYLGDIGVPATPTPMDFHAWFEAWIDGAWRTFDARHNKPRTGRVLIASGRDAADVAFTTSFGPARLTRMQVWADQVEPGTALPDVWQPPQARY
ncbi:transglutaminase [Deinococcus malanensis]|uniref:Transglutaminase n=1 Tax=Deinococcus malanensis TaxID=1706855 RepID=A0ABQ2EQZ5_9DEIO|nr:transglutaminase family protein [Deinococcus malanensis]GGK17696.1 transglutaminase [Deinococcus malanensis]